MSSFLPAPLRRAGIAGKIALLSWSVAILTLLIFVGVIIPEQKRIYLENLESKGRGVAVSLQNVAAGAVVTEDYSTVVDYCGQLLSGDPAIEYLILTRKDGFALVNDRTGWRTTPAEAFWHPNARASRSGIEKAIQLPTDNRATNQAGLRVFHYSAPFDYSGIEWGWIHVGLSLTAYDRNVVGNIYQRTGLLAGACVVIGLVVSLGYARRLVRPIRDLQSVVRKIAGGDFSACAVIRTGDEIESLAEAFNTMADTLRHRERILESVRFAAQQFLSATDWNRVLNEALANIGQAAGVSRAQVFENYIGADGTQASSIRFEWLASPEVAANLRNPKARAVQWAALGLHDTAKALERGEIMLDAPRPTAARRLPLLDPAARASIAIPIKVGSLWWGFMGFDDCERVREWGAAQLDSFRAAADILGAAIERQQTQDALVEAKENLEVRVHKRTKELQEQIQVTERAMAKLAETQQSLMDMSRHAGMAEVATGVLHNVGNVLNSVNVSTTLLVERIRGSRIPRLKQLSELLQTHHHDLPEFLTRDPAGRQATGYLAALADNFAEEQASQLEELQNLRKNVEHIKDIVSMQQSYAKVSGFIESVALADLVDDAVRLNSESLRRRSVQVRREYDSLPPLLLDKHRVLQILINLIRNGAHALEERAPDDRVLTVRIRRAGADRVRVEVQDNGVGIPPENLVRVFQHGFTTRRDGHGFGLHSGALAAKEMGGDLHALSDGPGHGATFTLELPFTTTPVAAPSADAAGSESTPPESDEF